MPIIKSAKKRVRTSLRRAAVNQLHRIGSKTAVRTANRAIDAKDASATAVTRQAESRLDRAATKGSIHKNKAARLKSRLAKKLNTVAATAPAKKTATKKTAKKA